MVTISIIGSGSSLIGHHACVNISLCYGIIACVDPGFIDLKDTVIIGISHYIIYWIHQWIRYHHVGQAYITFVGYREGVRNGLIWIGTLVTVLIIENTYFDNCNRWVLTQ